MIISIIAAMDQNRLIGANNGLPWHLPADFRHFREVTMGKPVIMGRKTFESIGKPLPGRTNIVVSRSGFTADGVFVADSIETALQQVRETQEVMILGGESFYKQMMDKANRMYLTYVNAQCEGDAWFPAFDKNDWHVIAEKHYVVDEKNNYSFSTLTYERNK